MLGTTKLRFLVQLTIVRYVGQPIINLSSSNAER